MKDQYFFVKVEKDLKDEVIFEIAKRKKTGEICKETNLSSLLRDLVRNWLYHK